MRRKKFLLGLSAVLIISFSIILPVYAEEKSELVLFGEPEIYEVQEGDCLWKIAERFLGDGSRYGELLKGNEALISNPDLIYPGTSLQIAEEVYVPELGNSVSGTSMAEYRFSTPVGWTVGVFGDNDIGANFAWSGNMIGDGGDDIGVVLCLIQDKEAAGEKAVADWERTQESIRSYVETEYADVVSDLRFNKYYTVGGDEACFCSYIYTSDFADYGLPGGGTIDYKVCAGIRLTDRISAQFIGFTWGENIEDTVHYIAASFEETAAPGGKLNVNDSNMAIWPDSTWELEGLYNSFPWFEGYTGTVAQSVADALLKPEEEKSEKQNNGWSKRTDRVERVLRQKEEVKSGNG